MREPRVRRTGLEFPDDFSYEEWVEFGRNRLAPAVTQLAFSIGDWLLQGEGPYTPRNPWEDVGVLGLDTSVLREFKHVAGQTRVSARDEHVSWGTYLLLVQRDGGVDDHPDEIPTPPRCKGCGGPLFNLSGRHRKHCDNACKQRAYRRRTAEAPSS
jgi:hypothetical protein